MLKIIGLDDRYQLIREDGTQAIIPLNVSYIHQIDSEYASLILIDYTEIQGMATETFKYDAIEIDGQTFSDLDSAIASLGNVIAGGSSADALEMKVVTELPTVGSTKIIYLLQTDDNYEEWVYQNSEWIMIGQMNAQTYQGKDAIKVEKINTGDSATTIHWIVKNTDKFLTQDDSGATAIVDLKYEKESGGTDESGQTIYNHFLRLYGKDSGTPVTEIDINDLYKDNYLVSATYDDAKQALVLTFKIDNHYQNVEVPIPTAYKGKEAIKIEKAAGDSAFTVSLVVDNTSVSGLTQSNSGIKLVADDAINSASTNVVQNKKVYEALDAIHIVSGETADGKTYKLNVLGVDKAETINVPNGSNVTALTVDDANQQIILDKVNADGTVTQLSGNAENIIFENDVKDGLKVDNHELKVKLKDGEKVLTVDSGGVESHLSLSAETSFASGVVTNTAHLKGIEGTEIASATTKLKQGDNISLSLSADTIEISGKNYTIIESLTGTGKADVLYLYKQTDATTSAVTYTQYAYVDNAWVQVSSAEAIDINNYYTKTAVDGLLSTKANTATTYTKTEVDNALGDKADTSAVTESINEAVSGKQDTLVSGVNIKTINNESLLGEGNITIQGGGGVSSGEVETMIAESISGKVDTTAYTAYSAATDARLAEDEEVTAAGLNALNDALGDKADTSAVTASIAAAVSGKQDTLIAGSGITISGNVISSEGGGATYSAGTNISIDSANTINCTLPLSATGANNKSVIGGRNCSATNNYSFVYGDGNKHTFGSCGVVFGSSCTVENSYTFAGGWLSNSKKEGSFTYGQYVIANNKYEHSVGQFNNSVSESTTFGNSGNTLFSVGNGTASNARHNAFEVRQNGDIYVNDGTNDVKLQDTIRATASNTAALGGLSLVKITQAAYDQLATKDPNTLYIVTDS